MTLRDLKRTSLTMASALLLALPVWSGIQNDNSTSGNQSSTQQNTQQNSQSNSAYDNGQSSRTATSPSGQTSNDNGVSGQTATGTETTTPARHKTTKRHRRHTSTSTSSSESSNSGTTGASTTGAAETTGTATTSPQNQAEMVIPAGTRLVVRMTDSVNSDTNHPGDQFRGALDEDLVANGNTIAPRGSTVYGRLVRAGGAQIGLNNNGQSAMAAPSPAVGQSAGVGQSGAGIGTPSNSATASSNPNNPALGSGTTSLSTNSSAAGIGSLTTNSPGALGTTNDAGAASNNGMNNGTSGMGNTTASNVTTISPSALTPSTSAASPNEPAANRSGNGYNLPASEGGRGTTTTSGLSSNTSSGTTPGNQQNPNVQGTGAAANGNSGNAAAQDLTLVLTAIEINGRRYSLAGIDETRLSTTTQGANGAIETAGITDVTLDRGAPVTAVIASGGGGAGVGAGIGSGAVGSQIQVQGNHIVVPAQSVIEFRTQAPVTIGGNSVNR